MRQKSVVVRAAGEEPKKEAAESSALDDRIAAGEFSDVGSTKERMTRPLRKVLAQDPVGIGEQGRRGPARRGGVWPPPLSPTTTHCCRAAHAPNAKRARCKRSLLLSALTATRIRCIRAASTPVLHRQWGAAWRGVAAAVAVAAAPQTTYHFTRCVCCQANHPPPPWTNAARTRRPLAGPAAGAVGAAVARHRRQAHARGA